MTLEAILFDSNGTLIDIWTDEHLEEIYGAIRHFLHYQGIEMRRWEIKERYFNTLKAQLHSNLEVYPEFDAVRVWKAVLEPEFSTYTQSLPAAKRELLPLILAEMHRAISRRRLQLYPDVQPVLDQLRYRLPLAIVSDGQQDYARAELHAVGLLDYFQPIIVSGDHGFRKPDPRMFAMALDTLGIRPENALYVGNDMFRDIYGAQKAGMKAVFFSSNQGDKEYPGVTPDYTIYNFSELLSHPEIAALLAQTP